MGSYLYFLLLIQSLLIGVHIFDFFLSHFQYCVFLGIFPFHLVYLTCWIVCNVFLLTSFTSESSVNDDLSFILSLEFECSFFFLVILAKSWWVSLIFLKKHFQFYCFTVIFQSLSTPIFITFLLFLNLYNFSGLVCSSFLVSSGGKLGYWFEIFSSFFYRHCLL